MSGFLVFSVRLKGVATNYSFGFAIHLMPE